MNNPASLIFIIIAITIFIQISLINCQSSNYADYKTFFSQLVEIIVKVVQNISKRFQALTTPSS
jgi:hypothetical protein